MRINVTQAHIDTARKNRGKSWYRPSEGCAVVLALREHWPGVTAGFNNVLWPPDYHRTVSLPDDIRSKLYHFDDTGEMAPFSFDLAFDLEA
jgi:hypothetical protein